MQTQFKPLEKSHAEMMPTYTLTRWKTLTNIVEKNFLIRTLQKKNSQELYYIGFGFYIPDYKISKVQIRFFHKFRFTTS